MGTLPGDEFILERTALVECYSQLYNKGSDHVDSLSSVTGVVVLGPGPKCPQRRESANSIAQHSPPARHLQPLQACRALCRWFSLIIPTLQMRRLRLREIEPIPCSSHVLTPQSLCQHHQGLRSCRNRRCWRNLSSNGAWSSGSESTPSSSSRATARKMRSFRRSRRFVSG